MATEAKRTGLRGPAWLIAILAALGIGPSLSSPRPQPAPATFLSQTHPASAPPAAGEDEVPAHSAAELLENFLDTNPQEVNRAKPWSHAEQPAGARLRLKDSRANYRIEFLIATLPEPGSPPLRSVFDTDLDAISFALARAGYALASFDLPWLDEAKSDSLGFRLGQTIDITPPGAGARFEITPADHRRADREPGLMVFHREKADEAGRRLLVLFLVGESPTRGVNQPALRDALDQVVWLAGGKCGRTAAPLHLVRLTAAQPGQAPAEIRIIGPNFSGSAVSIRDTLEEWASAIPSSDAQRRPDRAHARDHHEPTELRQVHGAAKAIDTCREAWKPTVRIISGAATAISDELRLVTPAVEYFALRVPDAAMLKSIERRFLMGRAAQPPIVILSENTIYGTSFATAGKRRSGQPAASGFLKIPFPLHISDLRSAFGKDAAESTPLVSPLSKRNLALPEEAGQQEQDVVPAFSRRSAVYDELVLQNLLQTIRAARARYVGVVATDVEDLIFLVQEIRAYCPDVVIFTTSADLLLTHSDFAPDLVGLLVFSTFPLFNPAQPWMNVAESAGARLQFPSEAAEGIYNATLTQLGRPEWMLDYGEPFQWQPLGTLSPADLFGQLDPELFSNAPRLPALWLSVVGREGLWPLNFDTPTLTPEGMRNILPVAALDTGEIPDLSTLYPLSFQVASLILTALCLIPCVAFLRPAPAIATPRGPGAKGSQLNLLTGASVFADLRAERELRLAAFIGALLLAYLVGLGFYLLPLRAILWRTSWSGVWNALQWPVRIVAIFGIVVVLPLVVAAFVVALTRAWSASVAGLVRVWRGVWRRSTAEPIFDRELGAARDYWVQPTWASFALLATVTGVVLVSVFVGSMWWQSPEEALFSFIRSASLGNRVSPLMALIFLGAANLCLIGGDLWRIRLLEDCRVNLPFLGFDAADSFGGVAQLEQQVVEALECPPQRLAGWWLMVLFLAVGFGYFASSKGGWVHPKTVALLISCSLLPRHSFICIFPPCCCVLRKSGACSTACCVASIGIPRAAPMKPCVWRLCLAVPKTSASA